METDASRLGWGACCQGVRTEGRWTPLEKQIHINYLELLAAFLALYRLPSEQDEIERSPTDQQCHSDCFSEQNGWHSFSGAFRSSIENLGMVHRGGDRYSRRTPPWQGVVSCIQTAILFPLRLHKRQSGD